MKYAVTISRTYGSGGKELGRLIAKKLGIECYGREALNADTDFDDDESLKYSLVMKGDKIDFEAEDEVFKRQSEMILSLAEKGSCVFVGRCADYVLRNNENVVRLFIHSSPRECMRRVMRLYELNPDDAKLLIREMNKSRSQYYSYHTKQSRDNALNYDLCVNVSGLDDDTAADMIIAYIKKRLEMH